jgi:hypothetical protein
VGSALSTLSTGGARGLTESFRRVANRFVRVSNFDYQLDRLDRLQIGHDGACILAVKPEFGNVRMARDDTLAPSLEAALGTRYLASVIMYAATLLASGLIKPKFIFACGPIRAKTIES